MNLRLKLFALVVGLIMAICIFRSIKRNNIRPSSALLWGGIALFMLSIPILTPLYQWISTDIIGMIDARHIIYIPLILFLLVYSFYLTVKVSQLSDRVQELVSMLAILDKEIKEKNDQT